MQGQEALEQETETQSTAGIDCGKDWLDLHVLPSGDRLRVANNRQGIARLKRFLTRFELQCVVVEATGKWHRPVWRSLWASGFPVAMIDPFRVRMFAKAQGILAKTDRLDARVLAHFAGVMAPPGRPPAPEIMEELAELVAAREAAVAERTSLKNQRSAAQGAFLKTHLAKRINHLGKAIAALDEKIAGLIAADPALVRRQAILTSSPGIGPIVAHTLIALLSEFGSLTGKQIAMLAGLAPIADDSGKRQGVRVVWGGRVRVRRAFYLAALSAARYNAGLCSFHKRLIAQGKPPKLAIIAVARKLAILANTLISKDRKWQPVPPRYS
jgi:transposase